MVEQLLQGQYEWTGNYGDPLLDSLEMKEFLAALKRPVSQESGIQLPNISTHITEDEYLNMFNKTAEGTGSLPPIHYGHYKAACE